MKKVLRNAAFAAVAVAGVVLVFRGGSVAEQEAVPMPLVLSKVQALGELHTARYTYQHVFEQSSSRKPQEWARYVPGASSIVLASTRNSALASATAQVEAGVDLSKARVEDGNLVLPKPAIYRPVIDTHLHQVRRGLFWRDDNLAQRASSAMEYRVRRAAQEQGIIEEAKRNVATALSRVAPGVPIRFEP